MKESYLKIEQDDSKKEYPEHYELKSIRAITSVSNSRGNPELQLLSVYRDYGVIPKKERNDNHNRESDDLSTYKIVKPGQLVINKMKAWQGSLGVSDYHGIVSPAYIVCDLDQNLNKKFVHLLLRSHPFVSELNRVSYGVRVNQWDLRYDEFKRISIRLPKRSEQDAIVDFLSKKIAEINRFVEIKEKLISLLAELKVRILNELVTSGTFSKMNTMISEKEYGTIVTTNWKKIRLKFLTEFIVDCLHSTPVYSEDGEYPAIRTADIEPGAIRENGIKKVDHAQFIERTQRAEPKENDILYSREGGTLRNCGFGPIGNEIVHFSENDAFQSEQQNFTGLFDVAIKLRTCTRASLSGYRRRYFASCKCQIDKKFLAFRATDGKTD